MGRRWRRQIVTSMDNSDERGGAWKVGRQCGVPVPSNNGRPETKGGYRAVQWATMSWVPGTCQAGPRRKDPGEKGAGAILL
jgi:hypothetical protein